MSFNDKLTKWQTGLDRAYEEVLDAGDRAQLLTEALEDEILTDEDLFTRMAVAYCRWTTTYGYPVGVTFLEWSVDRLWKERTPEHTKAWEVE